MVHLAVPFRPPAMNKMAIKRQSIIIYHYLYGPLIVFSPCDYLDKSYLIYTEGKSLAIYFEDSQFRRNRTFNFIVSKIYVDKGSRVR